MVGHDDHNNKNIKNQPRDQSVYAQMLRTVAHLDGAAAAGGSDPAAPAAAAAEGEVTGRGIGGDRQQQAQLGRLGFVGSWIEMASF